MANKMLIDASHPEETRVVVLRGNRVEEFDFESVNKKQLRGNIYLAKVTRVEPSLQAAFVDYGGNRHGFLAFSEIHPDYYQIPVVDRQALIEEEALAQRDEEQDEGRGARRSRRHRRNGESAEKRRVPDDETLVEAGDVGLESEAQSPQLRAPEDEAAAAEPNDDGRQPFGEDHEPASAAEVSNFAADEVAARRPFESAETPASPEPISAAVRESENETETGETRPPTAHAETAEEAGAASHAPHRLVTDPEGFAVVEDDGSDVENGAASEREGSAEEALEARFRPERAREDEDEGDEEADQVEQLGGDAMEEVPVRPHRLRRQYKIQEVIKRRQVLLVQVVKEERGNKGAALTTYLSLAGRYSVLMPNTARGGGISRKITDSDDRQRLKAIAQDLEVPDGMGVILRTAGASRTKAEVKRDFEYLLRMWETVREMTLKSTAPALVYEEGSLVKRAIRDLYNKDIDEIIVSGENSSREAKEFMRLLMPSHAKNVHLYRDPQPLFGKLGVESQLDAMFSNHVTLKSGGYLVINQTEALVAIDVNSGRSTREHNIEDTALRTNLEASDEIARQLRLRDLAGLIVVDFIDMEETRNNRSVERRLKEALKNDRARIQIGRISHFGLLEMSRQRMRTGVLEGSTVVCSHCAGAGMVRSTSSIALHVLRLLEDTLLKSASHNITVRTRTEVALYILNQKRSNLRDLERRFGVSITIAADDSLTGTAYHAMERGEPATGIVELPRIEAPPPVETGAGEDEESLVDEGPETETQGEERDTGEADVRKRRRRRRRRGRGGEPELSGNGASAPLPAEQPSDDGLALFANLGSASTEVGAAEIPEAEGAEELGWEGTEEQAPRREGRRRRPRRRGRDSAEEIVREGELFHADRHGKGLEEIAAEHGEPAGTADHAPAEPHVAPYRAESVEPVASTAVSTPAQEPASAKAAMADTEAVRAPAAAQTRPEPALTETLPEPDPNLPKRTGWWQRAKASLGG
ncbi:MAG: Rne/Rng family ribonuclease [Beijerinckiaceae bacterium]